MLRSVIWYYLLFVPHIIVALVAICIYRRRLYRQLPFFFAYCIYEFATFPCIAYGIFSKAISHNQYQFFYEFELLGSIVLRFGVIYELFANLSRSYVSLEKFCRFLFRALVVFLLFVSVVLVALSIPGHAIALNMFMTFVLDRAVNLLQLGLLLGLFGIANFFGLTWRKHIFGITLGFAIYLSIQLVSTAIQLEWGFVDIFDYITMATFHAVGILWLFYILRPEPKPPTIAMAEQGEVTAWNEELTKLLQTK